MTPDEPASGRRRRRGRAGSRTGRAGLLFGLPALVILLVLFVWPLAGVAVLSFRDAEAPGFTLARYARIATDPFYRDVASTSLWMALVITAITLVLGYPAAYHLVRSRSRYKHLLFIALVAPLLVSVVVRTLGWLMLLGDRGPIQWLLSTLGGASDGHLLFNRVAVIVGMVHVELPFMILAVASALAGIDRRVEETASVLGASPPQVFVRVTLPLSLPGIVSGSILVFSLVLGAYLTPVLLGGGKVQTVASAIYDETLTLLDWPQASALAMTLLLAVLALLGGSLLTMRRLLGRAA